VGARVTLVAPPALIPREAEAALGVEVRDIADADLVYVQREAANGLNLVDELEGVLGG